MKNLLFLILFIFSFLIVKGQDPNEDYTWWNELHGWERGDPGWRNWMIISPGYLGPNALPIPDVKRGFLNENADIKEIPFELFNVANDKKYDLVIGNIPFLVH